jgi:hypothetical protein
LIPKNTIYGDDRARFISKIIMNPQGCWGWLGTIGGDSYAQFSIKGHNIHASRVAYESTYERKSKWSVQNKNYRLKILMQVAVGQERF